MTSLVLNNWAQISQCTVVHADTLQPLYNTVHYNTVLDITRFKARSQNLYITKTRLFKYIENFTSKNKKNSDKKNLIFFIFQLKT